MAYIKNPTTKQKREWAERAKRNCEEATNIIHTTAINYVKNPEKIAEFLQFGSRFYPYSVKNNILIREQNPHATFVQSFDAWRKMGCSVNKGEHGLKIFVPVKSTTLQLPDGSYVALKNATKEQKAAYEKGEIHGSERTSFQIGTVFDISQTNYPKEDYPKLFYMGYPSEMHFSICEGLKDFCRKINYSVEEVDMKSISLRGSCDYANRSIKVNTLLEDTQRLSTLAHEIGHALRADSRIGISLSQRELEADAISIMLQTNFGIDINDTRKEHFKEHFDKYVYGLEQAAGHNLDQEEIADKLDELLSSVMGTYKENIDTINECVEKYVPHERILEYEHNKQQKSYIYEACKTDQSLEREYLITEKELELEMS